MEVPSIDRAGATDLAPTPPAPPVSPVPPSAAPMAAPSVAQGLGERPLPVPPAAMPEPAPEPVASPSLFVSFVGVNKKGKQRFGRITVQGMFPPRQVAVVNAIENAIAKERDLTQVELISWSMLEG